jgi:hypothetical protein
MPPFDTLEPSAENQAKYFYDEMKSRLPAADGGVDGVRQGMGDADPMGPVLGADVVHLTPRRLAHAAALLGLLLVAGCGSAPPEQRQAGSCAAPRCRRPCRIRRAGGVHVLALERAPGGALWAGTFGDGMYVLRRGSPEWQRIAPSDTEGAIAWGFVNSIAFGRDTLTVWYGTVGNRIRPVRRRRCDVAELDVHVARPAVAVRRAERHRRPRRHRLHRDGGRPAHHVGWWHELALRAGSRCRRRRRAGAR